MFIFFKIREQIFCLLYIKKAQTYDRIHTVTVNFIDNLKSASNLNGNLNCSKELEHYAS